MVLSKNYTQLGRNMIEMLGVLAIVGVLSVGGIAGYNKAMTKIHINQAIQQISQIAMGIQTLHKNQKTIDDLSPNVLKKAQIIDVNTDTSLYGSNPPGTRINASPIGSSMLVDIVSTGKEYQIGFYDLPEEACIALASYNWTVLDGFEFFSIWRGDNGLQIFLRAYAKPTGSQTYVPTPLDLITQACADGRHFHLVFKLL